MSDHPFDPAPPDLELIAQLIDDSSLGSAEAFEAQNEVPPGIAMSLRDRARQDAPDRRWHSLPASASVLATVTAVVPNVDGSFDVAEPIPVDRRILAVNRGGECLELDPPLFRLPGGVHRQEWTIYRTEAEQAYRCTLQWLAPARPEQHGQWAIEAAIWWEATEPDKAAQHHLTALTADLLPAAAHRLGYALDNVPDTVGKQILFENSLSHVLRERGIAAECAVRIVWQDRPGQHEPALRPSPTPPPFRPAGHYSPGAADPPPPARPGAADQPAELTSRYVIDAMNELHQEGRVDYSHEYLTLAARALARSRSERDSWLDPGSETVPDVSGAAYVLTLLNEALRVAGLQVDDARARIVDFLETFSGTTGSGLFETVVDDCVGCRPGGGQLPFMANIMARVVMAGVGGPSRERPLFPPSQDSPRQVRGDIEARRQERYEYDGQFA